MARKRQEMLKGMDELHMQIKYYGLLSNQFPGQWQYFLCAKERDMLLHLIDIQRDKLRFPPFWVRIKEWFTS